MGLPRHLREKFSATDGAPIDADPAGSRATSESGIQLDAGGPRAEGSPYLPSIGNTESDHEVDAHDEADDQHAHVEADERDAGSLDDAPHDGDNSPEANFRRMEGRYKAEISTLKTQLNRAQRGARGTQNLTDLLMQTRQELADLRAASQNGKSDDTGSSKQAAKPPELPDLTDEEREMYGDFTPVAEKLIARAQAPLLEKIAELEGRTGNVGKQLGMTEERQFVRDVGLRVGDMDTLTRLPEWAEYLQRDIPFAGITLQDALMHAHNARDLNRVVSIFDAFKQERGAGRSAAAGASGREAGAADPRRGASDGEPARGPRERRGLSHLATPDRTAASGNNGAKPKFRESDYRKRMNQMRSGHISKEAFMQFEAEFFEAQNAGLVQKT